MSEDHAALSETLRSPLYAELYSNFARTRVSPWDIKITFSMIKERVGGDAGIVEELVSVTMSPHHFKVFLQIANEALGKFEESMGEVQVPDKFLPRER